MAATASQIRELVRADIPLLVGAHPNRPSPIHILNNLVALALGDGGSGAIVADLVKSGVAIPPLVCHDAEQIEPAREVLEGLFNADGKVNSGGFSSPFPVLKDFAKQDPSDDRYAFWLWNSLDDAQRLRVAQSLASLFAVSSPACEAVTQLGLAVLAATAPGNSTQPTVISGPGTLGGVQLGNVLVQGLERSKGLGQAQRLEELRKFAVMSSAIVLLIMLEDAIASSKSEQKDTRLLGDRLQLVVFTGRTPGDAADPLVALSSMSLEATITRAHQGVLDAATAVLRSAKNQTQLISAVTARVQGQAAQQLVQSLLDHGVMLDEESAVRAMYPVETLRLGVRSFGVKVGFCGPQRGYGNVRLIFETTFLSALVHYVVADGLTLQQLVDRCYEQLGLIVGLPTSMSGDAEASLRELCGRQIDLEQQLLRSQTLFQERLVAAGLARKYSDGTTIVEA